MRFKRLVSLLENEERPIDIKQKFIEIEKAGETQRRIPEDVMLRTTLAIQKLGAPAIIVNQLEHYGDLSNRAGRMNSLINVSEKVYSTFNKSILGDPQRWTAQQEIERNFDSNLKYILENPDYYKIDTSISYEELKNINSEKICNLIENYIKAHEEHNDAISELQIMGKNVAILFAQYAISVLKGDERISLLFQLRHEIKSIRSWLDKFNSLPTPEERDQMFCR